MFQEEFMKIFKEILIEVSFFLHAGLLIGLFVLSIGLIVIYVMDRSQTQQAIRRNYPIVGHFRYLFESLGEFFRQYFFSMDREELPFNRAQRSWVYRAAKDLSTTSAFGSTKDLRPVGSIFFVNCPFPELKKDTLDIRTVTIGPYCKTPYKTKSLINISAMSFGAISRPAVLALSKGAKMAGCWMNTGEGGLAPYHLEGGADIIYQIGTAKNGVRTPDGKLDDVKLAAAAKESQVKMFELKLSQGAKPGKGGILPGGKVTSEIAAIRGIPEGQDALSPNRHPEINNNGELLDVINHIRDVTGKPTGFKMALGAYGWLETLMKLIIERGHECAPDFIAIDSADGGSGAAPMALIDNMGLPLRESLPMVVDNLIKYNLRDRIKVIASGKLINPADVAWALCLGTDFINSARGFMFSIGCIQALQCNKNTCPTGITTHNKRLQAGLVPEEKSVRVANFVANMNYEVAMIAHSCGVKEPRELKRHHVRVVAEDGLSISLEDRYPTPEPIQTDAAA